MKKKKSLQYFGERETKIFLFTLEFFGAQKSALKLSYYIRSHNFSIYAITYIV